MTSERERQDVQEREYEAPTLTEFGRVEDFTEGIGISVVLEIF